MKWDASLIGIRYTIPYQDVDPNIIQTMIEKKLEKPVMVREIEASIEKETPR